jgi:hypothetical protein
MTFTPDQYKKRVEELPFQLQAGRLTAKLAIEAMNETYPAKTPKSIPRANEKATNLSNFYDRFQAEAKAKKGRDHIKNPDVAYEAAHAIKPEIDHVASLQKRIDNPLAAAARTEIKGKTYLIGAEDVRALELERKATVLDAHEILDKAAIPAAETLVRLQNPPSRDDPGKVPVLR